MGRRKDAILSLTLYADRLDSVARWARRHGSPKLAKRCEKQARKNRRTIEKLRSR